MSYSLAIYDAEHEGIDAPPIIEIHDLPSDFAGRQSADKWARDNGQVSIEWLSPWSGVSSDPMGGDIEFSITRM